MPWNNLQGPAKVLAISVAVLLVAAGLCGVQVTILSGLRGNSPSLESVFMLTGFVELGAMLIAGIVAVVSILAWIGTAIYNGLTSSTVKRNEPQKLFDDSDKHDEPHS
jgi:hypothetical protein